MARWVAERDYGRRRGVVLLAVLVVIVLLSLAAYHYSDVAFASYKSADLGQQMAQAQALADSGIHYAAALLSNPDSLANVLNNNPYDNPTAFSKIKVPGAAYSGFFTIMAPPGVQYTTFRHGVIDEAAKLNLNALMLLDQQNKQNGNLLFSVLSQLPNMTEDVAASMVDWLDPDDDTFAAGGAESAYYSGLPTPYRPKNGPLDSLDELLLVKGVTPDLLFGQFRNPYPLPQRGQTNNAGNIDLGWSAFLTAHSREVTTDLNGKALVNINDNNLSNISQNLTPLAGAALTNYIILYRQYGGASTTTGAATSSPNTGTSGPGTGTKPNSGKKSGGGNKSGGGMSGGGKSGGGVLGGGGKSGGGKSGGGGTPAPVTKSRGGSDDGSKSTTGVKPPPVTADPASATIDFSKGGKFNLKSMFSLINTKVTVPGTGNNPDTIYNSPLNDPGNQATMLPTLFTNATLWKGNSIPARVNINTAPEPVLNALFYYLEGGNAQQAMADVTSIVSNQPSWSSGQPPSEIYATPTWLLTMANLDPKLLAKVDPYITTRSQVYRVQVQGTLESSGLTARVEAVVDTNGGMPRILAYRNLTELGKGGNGYQTGNNR
jgi:type II secretory pathway component PulK